MSNGTQIQKGVVIALVGILLAGCNLPRDTVASTHPSGAVYTAAARTVSAHLTEAAVVNPGSGRAQTTDTPPPAGGLSSSETPHPSSTPGGTQDPTGVPCNRLTFLKDVSHPDGTDLQPGEEFTKTWRLKNAGSCPWTPGYMLVFDRGDAMGGPASVQLTKEDVPPGESVDVSVDLAAPDETGTYQGYWKVRSDSGEVFGYGEDLKAFWVKIDVAQGSGVMLDFNARAADAAWGTGSLPLSFDRPGEDVLVFSASADAGESFVDLKQDQKLENESVSDYVLVTFPPAREEGYIIGRYPVYQVNPGDEISGRVGLILNADDSCGAGDVSYRIYYRGEEGSFPVEKLWTWHEICDGEMKSFRIKLDDLEGAAVRIYLVVVANTSSGEHFAVWDSLAIKR